ncbi:MAG TPA: hypothetical protein DF613_11210, partial [Lachnospiraceae bacterium]|nr:hypothetical protein [Lachnospiraceae bacterium]
MNVSMKHLLSLQKKHTGRKRNGQRQRMTALLLCLCLVCSNLVSTVYAAMDITGAVGSGAIAGGSGQFSGSSENGGSENGAAKDGGEKSDLPEDSDAAKSTPEDTGNAADSGQTQNGGSSAASSPDKIGAGTVIVGGNTGNSGNIAGSGAAEAVTGEYKLYITHVLAVDGYLFADEDVEVSGGLTEEDLSGGYNVLRNAYTRTGMAVDTKELTVTKADFDNKVCYAEINYRVADGYEAVYTLPDIMTRSIYTGPLTGVEFRPVTTVNTIEVKLRYKFHSSTGMSGVPAYNYDQVVLTPEGDNYNLHQKAPNVTDNPQLADLWLVLNPKPLDELQAKLDAGDISSAERDQALEEARTVVKEGTANGAPVRIVYTYEPVSGEVRASIPRAAFNSNEADLLTLDVYYYRWAPSCYKIQHRVIGNDTYRFSARDKQDTIRKGHEGALTDVKAGEAGPVVENGIRYIARSFSQQQIEKAENSAEPKTCVTIYYDAYDEDSSYQVVFNTDGGSYIAPKAVGAVAQDGIYLPGMSAGAEAAPTKAGYEFECWQYTPASGGGAETIGDGTPGYSAGTGRLFLGVAPGSVTDT